MSHVSSGGSPSVDFQLDEFERAAALLSRAGERLIAVRMLITTALADAGPSITATGRVVPSAAEGHLRSGNQLAIEVGDTLAECRSGLEASRASYEQAERRAALQAYQRRSAVLPATVQNRFVSNHGHPDAQATEDLINVAPGYGLSWLLLGGYPSSNPAVAAASSMAARLLGDRNHGGPFGSSVADRAATGLSGLAALRSIFNVRPIHVGAVSTTEPETFGGTLPDLMELQRRAEAQVSGEGAVLVTTTQTVRGPVHVLTIPGTQPAREGRYWASRNPFDESGIVEGTGMGSSYVAQAATEALESAGAHPGERLVITGYSQGGIHAANLAVDENLSTRYDVEYVVTTGSPVGSTALPDATRGLHLEHVDDMVPGLDGRPNPETSNQVTVHFDGYAPDTDLEAGGFGAAHQLGNYTQLSDELAASDDPGVVEARTTLGAVFAGAGTATVTTVKLRREPSTGPRKARIKPVRRSPRRPGRRALDSTAPH
ncbi:hypothetical protein ACTXOR_11795 [Arthrobacter rhombi]|uniref:hypothetical protein n=2 Tax=Arthrobacter rhombi TaxID=71253 RepID=UPI003FD19B9E